ncbi:NADPH oxidase 4-like [Amphiura filiformis]|uniref:NADPH oxidase 4-like n=1 Tax=Amphiura filiformis TaxID=82378 RepID=UPI003B226CF9
MSRQQQQGSMHQRQNASNSRQIRKSRVSICSWLRNGGFKYIFATIWLALNAGIFCWSFYLYKLDVRYHYLRQMIGMGLYLSRGSASVINVNAAVILLPMCRSIFAIFRSKHMHRSTRRLFDSAKFIHILCALLICIAAAIHCVAHFFNAFNFSRQYNSEFPDVNVAQYRGQSPCWIIFSTVPGVTGCVMVVTLTAIVLTSCRAVRTSRHELFRYSHQLFFLFYALLVSHSLGGVLKEQCNVAVHSPGCITIPEPMAEPEPETYLLMREYRGLQPEPEMNMIDSEPDDVVVNETTVCIEKPVFRSHQSETWCFILIPACLYLIERLWRAIRSRQPVDVISIRMHPCDVIELELMQDDFSAKPGQYVLLQCPHISQLEWHPFTITSCPTKSKPTFKLHIRVRGDWTVALQEDLLKSSGTMKDSKVKDFQETLELPRFYVDGPYGSPSEDVFRYRTSVCIAGGVGVTPYAAVLQALLDESRKSKLRRLYFIWVCRDWECFIWFAELISTLHKKLWDSNRPDFLVVRLYLSKPSKSGEEWPPPVLQQPVFSRIEQGRPNFKELLDEVTLCNSGSDIGVFVCGPRKLSQKVHRLCNARQKNKTKLHFNKETFS